MAGRRFIVVPIREIESIPVVAGHQGIRQHGHLIFVYACCVVVVPVIAVIRDRAVVKQRVSTHVATQVYPDAVRGVIGD